MKTIILIVLSVVCLGFDVGDWVETTKEYHDCGVHGDYFIGIVSSVYIKKNFFGNEEILEVITFSGRKELINELWVKPVDMDKKSICEILPEVFFLKSED